MTPVIKKTIGMPALKAPAVSVTVSTSDDMLYEPVAPLGDMNASNDVEEKASPVPVSEMIILPLEGTTIDWGVRDTVIVTLVSPMSELLRVMLG